MGSSKARSFCFNDASRCTGPCIASIATASRLATSTTQADIPAKDCNDTSKQRWSTKAVFQQQHTALRAVWTNQRGSLASGTSALFRAEPLC